MHLKDTNLGKSPDVSECRLILVLMYYRTYYGNGGTTVFTEARGHGSKHV
jgi:hypothetical protein